MCLILLLAVLERPDGRFLFSLWSSGTRPRKQRRNLLRVKVSADRASSSGTSSSWEGVGEWGGGGGTERVGRRDGMQGEGEEGGFWVESNPVLTVTAVQYVRAASD